jgi:O-antigen/teichoic acid export membrane protein
MLSRLRDPLTGAIRGPVWVAASAAITGAATYAALILVARVLGPVAYADFAVFWSFVVIASFGVFLPVEQEVARRVARAPRHIAETARPALAVALGYAVVLAVVGAVVWRWLGSSGGGGAALVVGAVVLLCAALAAQFTGRGVLSGRLELTGYASVVTVDSLLRLALFVLVAIAGAVGLATVGGFAMAVTVSAGVAAAVAWWRVRRLPVISGSESVPPSPDVSILGGSARLIVGALCMQLLLNSGPLIARADATPSNVEFAGHLLATMTLARVPVFIFQSIQATYLARVAQAGHEHDSARLRRTLTALAGLVTAVGCATVLFAAAVGPLLVQLIYGESFDISREAAVLVAVGVALYVIATVANDTNVALGHHPRVAVSWLAAVVTGALSMALTDSLLLRSTLPLIVGSLVAAASLITGVRRTVRELSV